jgi:hypothetical protein
MMVWNVSCHPQLRPCLNLRFKLLSGHSSTKNRLSAALRLEQRRFLSTPPTTAYCPDIPLPYQMLRERFRTGDSYTWLYRQKEDHVATSWERYKVTDVHYPYLVLEMASKFSSRDVYQTHHRMIVHIEQQLTAVHRPDDWKLVAFEYLSSDTEKWILMGDGSNVQAWEEKFNVWVGIPTKLSPMEHRTMVMSLQKNGRPTQVQVVRPQRHRYTNSWYGLYPDHLRGVALFKDFGEHTFELIEQTRNGTAYVFDGFQL